MTTKTKMFSPPPAASIPYFANQLPVGKLFDHNNNEQPSSTAILFKYNSNASSKEIEQFRQLLTHLRSRQATSIDPEEFGFYEADYKRMMLDDWLVTRFLLRGKKAFEREAESNDSRYKILQLDTWVEDGEDGRTSPRSRSDLDKKAIILHTIELVKVCARYRFDYRINGRTRLSEFPAEWINTNGLFDYKPDAAGNPTVYLRVALHRPKLIETPEARHLFKRYMLYTLERCDQALYNRTGKAICCVFDMTKVAFENIDLELTTWMIKSFKSSSPKLVCYVIIFNPPWFFTATFKVICSTLLSNSKRQSVKFVSGNEILNYIDRNNLPPYLMSSLS